jgi:hypothetical protein
MLQKKLLDFLIRQTAKEVLIDESIVDTIVRDQWAQLFHNTYDLKEMEIAGIGSIYPTQKKIVQRIDYYERIIEKMEKQYTPGSGEIIRESKERLIKMRRKKDELDQKSMGE